MQAQAAGAGAGAMAAGAVVVIEIRRCVLVVALFVMTSGSMVISFPSSNWNHGGTDVVPMPRSSRKPRRRIFCDLRSHVSLSDRGLWGRVTPWRQVQDVLSISSCEALPDAVFTEVQWL